VESESEVRKINNDTVLVSILYQDRKYFIRSAVWFIFFIFFDRIACAQCVDAAFSTHVARGLCNCVCVFGTRASCAKTAEPIEMLTVVQTHLGPRPREVLY